MVRKVRWIKAAHKSVEGSPLPVQRQIARALDVAALGEMAEVAKRFKGLGAGVFEIAVRYRTDAYRAIYALKSNAAQAQGRPARRGAGSER